jgi:hypothetical protein
MSSEFPHRLAMIAPVLVLSIFLFGFEQRGIQTEQGLYLVDVQFPGSSLKVGKNTMDITVNDRKSLRPVAHRLLIDVVPWMPAHEHGSMSQAKVAYLGEGRYRVENLSLTMAGDWEVYFKITDQGREDTAVFNVVAGR